MGLLDKVAKAFSLEDQDPPESIRDITVRALYEAITDYSNWYECYGLYLPSSFATDPTGWTEALHKMKRAFQLLYDELHQEGELWDAKQKWVAYGEQDVEQLHDLEKEVTEGIRLFGENLMYMTDPKIGTSPGQ